MISACDPDGEDYGAIVFCRMEWELCQLEQ